VSLRSGGNAVTELRDEVVAYVATRLKISKATLTESTDFVSDLGIDSMRALDLVADVEVEIPDDRAALPFAPEAVDWPRSWAGVAVPVRLPRAAPGPLRRPGRRAVAGGVRGPRASAGDRGGRRLPGAEEGGGLAGGALGGRGAGHAGRCAVGGAR